GDNGTRNLIRYGVSNAVSSGNWLITPGSQTVNESDGRVVFTITRSNSGQAQTVYVSTTQDHGTHNNGDYIGWYNVPVTFAAGQTSEDVSILVTNDTIAEPDETFGLIVQQSPIDPISPNLASSTFTIHDDDAVQHSSTLAIATLDADKNEGNSGATPFTFTVTRTGDTSGTTAVNWSVGVGPNPTANGTDFVAGAFPSGVVTFHHGDSSETITVIVQGDQLPESGGLPENFVVNLVYASGGAIINPLHINAQGRIQDDDTLASPPSLLEYYYAADSVYADNALYTQSGSPPLRLT